MDVQCDVSHSVIQLIQNSIEQYNSKFDERETGVSLRKELEYYELRPMDMQSMSAGSPIDPNTIVSQFKDAPEQFIDNNSDTRHFELTMKSR
jgi:hypothetical protein